MICAVTFNKKAFFNSEKFFLLWVPKFRILSIIETLVRERRTMELLVMVVLGNSFPIVHPPKVVIYRGGILSPSLALCSIASYRISSRKGCWLVEWHTDYTRRQVGETVFTLYLLSSPFSCSAVWQVATSWIELWLGNNLVNCSRVGSNGEASFLSSSSRSPCKIVAQKWYQQLIECVAVDRLKRSKSRMRISIESWSNYYFCCTREEEEETEDERQSSARHGKVSTAVEEWMDGAEWMSVDGRS